MSREEEEQVLVEVLAAAGSVDAVVGSNWGRSAALREAT